MEIVSKSRNDSRGSMSLGSAAETVASHGRPSMKLREILVSEKPSLSYADFHHDIIRNTSNSLPKTRGKHQSQGVQCCAKTDQTTRYMSNAPNYLEKGEAFQEKVLKVGVLDWKRLEEWKYSNDMMPNTNRGCSSTSTTSYVAVDGSSSRFTRGRVSSPAHTRSQQSSLQSHLDASPSKTRTSRDKNHGGRGHSCSPARQRTFHLVPQSDHHREYTREGQSANTHIPSGRASNYEVSSSIAYDMIRQQKYCEIDGAYRKCPSEARPKGREKRACGAGTSSETGKMQSLGSCNVAASPRSGKLMIRESELKKELLKLKDQKLNSPDPDCAGKGKRVVLLMPRDSKSKFLNASTADTHTKEEQGQKIFLDLKSKFNNASTVDTHTEEERSRKIFLEKQLDEIGLCGKADVPYSCPLPLKDERKSISEVRESTSMDRRGLKVFPRSEKLVSSPSRGRHIEQKNPIVVLKCPGEHKMSVELDKSAGTELASKGRHPSPIRRFSSAMGNIIRSVGSRESSPIRRSSSRETVVQPGLDRSGASASAVDCTDKSQANHNRSRSSPLRRLLDPLIKPKAPGEPSKRDSTPMGRLRKSSHDQLLYSREQPTKVKPIVTDGSSKGSNGYHQNAKQGSQKLQALLQVAVKNGLPLFTFAVDSCSDILAATLRKEKNRPNRLYTFFTVQEIEKKNGLWLNQAKNKGNNNNHQGYIPNVIAQMKVLNSQSPAVARNKGVNDDAVREYSLFSVDVSKMDQRATEFEPTNELAAIVVRHVESSHSSPRHSLSERRHSDCGVGSQDGCHGFCTSVILPGAIHTIPSEGSISTLTQRWRSGGACDCGGWDLGCQLRVFTANQSELMKTSNSSIGTDGADKFELYNQAGQESQLVLSLSPFKERIHSVEFDSSITLLQAFAISVSIFDCRGSPSWEAASDDKSPLYDLAAQGGTTAPASYVSYPPHSPVGRA